MLYSPTRTCLRLFFLFRNNPFRFFSLTLEPSSASTAGATCGTGTRGSASASRSKPTAANREAEVTGRWLLKCISSRILLNTAGKSTIFSHTFTFLLLSHFLSKKQEDYLIVFGSFLNSFFDSFLKTLMAITSCLRCCLLLIK